MAKERVALAVIVVLAAAAVSVAGMSCSDAVSALIPCEAYLLGADGAPPTTGCCQSVHKLNQEAATVPQRKVLCECFKQTSPSFGVSPERAKNLPALCKLRLNVPITAAINCSQ
ncbi:hypothetical protein HPP92_021514 [Vanilla planifolia]|uniref:Bifunctional inhibitor/plant lipid transfer protein/seed storage helical domain-containing protein n=1 Tax=Vanilla planifolia TaxID=51239 RepID=A0A835Q5R9_VANPL|nr:hypothetical protein HPP92_021879 [Vanilla planifolia]KAG0463038.1 hypothetical protein HPP92_021514 [Vanilla planifolia]